MSFEFIRSRHGRWVAIGFGGTFALFVVVWLALPRFAEAKAKERLSRLGLEWSAEGRSLGLSDLTFQDVAIRSNDSSRPLVQLGLLQVEFAWSRLFWGPRAALEQIRLVNLKADLSVEDLRRLRERRGASTGGASSGDGGSAQLPVLTIEAGELKLQDGAGTLVRAELSRFDLSATSWKAELASLELGSAAAELVALRGIHALGVLDGRQPRLAQGIVDSAQLVWSSRPSGDEQVAPEPGGLIARFKKLRAALRGPARATSSASEPADSPFWSADAQLELRNARVTDSAVPDRPILDRLRVSLRAQDARTLRVKGDGAASTDGSVLWDLKVNPRDAKIEGRLSLREVPFALFRPVLPKLPFYDLERTRVGADLAITGRGLESADVLGELSIRELAFQSERLALSPVGPISFTARGQGSWIPARRELSNLRGELQSGRTRVLITGALAWPEDAYRVDLRAELPKTRCDAVSETVPPGLLDELQTVLLSGELKAKLDMHVDSANLDATKLDFDIHDKCRFEELPEPMDVRHFEQPFTHRVLEPDGTMFEMETGPGTPAWTPIELISPFMIQAVVAHEDGRFFNHRGFAEAEIGNALAKNLKAHAFRFGASTITMQLVKNVFLHRDKLLSRKVQEALIVWWLEQQVDKKWILELYLNVIEYGTAVYGIRNAALHYFGVLPIHLTPAQAAFLATILPSPKAYDEQYAKGSLSESTKRKVAQFLQHMRSRDRIDDEALAYGMEELSHFRFYDPDKPPPVPAPVRGSAQAPPFQVGAVDGWNTFDSATKVEDGSFGLGL